MEIKVDALQSVEIQRFLEEHLQDMKSVSPPESKHALDLAGIRAPEVTFWSAYHLGQLVGCAALKQLDSACGEIKSMRVASTARGLGFGSLLLEHVIATAQARGYRQLKLETGSMDFFEPARQLYLKHGFSYCDAFAGYKPDPNSMFMQLHVAQ
ncbi:putative acetyltransferase [Atopomonas hussainii]|uniref:Putative acetyltransferase n=1 Tax=Atopomonas hussainii TaxID=1429083 RepID=A0A1H7T0Z0_9GAMM|nr:GNAT family N-acetyltransferase [Atopomonas hussainii]SEL78541.1 putative acetyltransferase [Atopomonas hussainii]